MRPARASAHLLAVTAYAGADQQPLQAVRASLANWISRLRRPDCGVHDVHALLDPEEHVLRRAVGRCLRQAAPDERLLLYICSSAALAQQPYLLGQDSDLRDLPGTGLPLGVLAELLQDCVAHEVLLLVDAHFPPGAEPGARDLSVLRRACGPNKAAVVLTRPDILEGVVDPPSTLGALLDGVTRGDVTREGAGLNLTDALRHFRRLGRRRGALGGLHVLGGPPPSGIGLVPAAPVRSSPGLARWLEGRRRPSGWRRWVRLAPALGIVPLALVALLGLWALPHGAARHPDRLVAAVVIPRAEQAGPLAAASDRGAPQAPQALDREAPQAPQALDREAPQAPRSLDREAPAAPSVLLHIDSSPSGARVTYLNHEAITPAELQLPRSAEPLVIQIDKPGYQPERLEIVADVPRSHFVALRPLDHQEKPAPPRSIAHPIAPPISQPINRTDREARSAAVSDREARSAAVADRQVQHQTAIEVNRLLDGFLEVRFRGCCRAAGPGACCHLMAEVSVLPSGKLGSLQAYLEPPHGRAEICIREVVRSALRREFSGFSGPPRTFERTYNFDPHPAQPR